MLLLVTTAFVVATAVISNKTRQERMREQGSFTRSGHLSPGDLRFEDGSGIFDGWSVDLASGQTLRVAVKTTDLPAQFRILGPMESATPKIVKRGSSVGPTEATAEFSPTQAGEYVIAVTSEGRPGAYQMTTNYRTEGLLSSSDEIEGFAEVIGVVLVFLAIVQYSGLPTFLGWRHPDRILLLRPFEEADVSRALKKLNRRVLAHRGFTFTLADKHLDNSFTLFLLANVPVDLGSLVSVLYRPLFRRMHRRVFVRRPGDLGILRLRLRSRWLLTGFWQSWLGFGDRINKFGSRNELWKDCMDVMLDDCQVVVVDMTRVGEGTLWELHELARRQYSYKSVFVLRGDEADEAKAKALLQQLGAESGFQAGMIHRYHDDGRLWDEGAFDEAYASAIASEQQPEHRSLPISRKAVAAVAPAVPFAPIWAVIGLPLAILALRDIRRTKGLLRGEVLAHLAVALYGLILIVEVSYAVILLLR